jgi:uncharacterized protein (TIGR00369 family)
MPTDYAIPQDGLRERTISWHDPVHAAPLSKGLSGLEIMERVRDGLLPGPPMTRLIGFRCILVEAGKIGMRLDYDPSLENFMGMAHGGVAATMLDTAMGCAAHTMLPAGSGIVTLDLTITYLKPITARQEPIVATGKVLDMTRRTIFVTGEIRAGDDTLLAHSVGNFPIVGPKPPTAIPPEVSLADRTS